MNLALTLPLTLTLALTGRWYLFSCYGRFIDLYSAISPPDALAVAVGQVDKDEAGHQPIALVDDGMSGAKDGEGDIIFAAAVAR